jgi:hypothetical protein
MTQSFDTYDIHRVLCKFRNTHQPQRYLWGWCRFVFLRTMPSLCYLIFLRI